MKQTVRSHVVFEGTLLRDALTEYLRVRGHDVKGNIKASVFRMLGYGIKDEGHVTLSWDGDPVQKGDK